MTSTPELGDEELVMALPWQVQPCRWCGFPRGINGEDVLKCRCSPEAIKRQYARSRQASTKEAGNAE